MGGRGSSERASLETDNFTLVQDTQIVALMAAGDRAGLAAAYDAYADRLHDYARSMLRTTDPDTAADVTHDTFLIAFAKAGDLRNPERLRPWLYAITRNECLRVLRQNKRTDHLDDQQAERLAEGSSDMSQHVQTTDIQELVRAAAEGLSPKDREVFDLGLRHDLAAPDIAAALGVSDNAAHAMLSRVRSQLERALGAFVVARDRSCPDLQKVLAGWDGAFDPLWRKRIARHVDSCETCAGVQHRELSPAALLAVAPIAAAPIALRVRLVSADLDLAHAEELAERAAPWRPDGFPGPAPSRRFKGALFAVAAVLLLIGGTVGAIQALNREGDTLLEAGTVATSAPVVPVIPRSVAPTPTMTSKPPTLTPPVVVTTPLTATPSPETPQPEPAPTKKPTRKPTRTPAPPPPGVSDLQVLPADVHIPAGSQRFYTGTVELVAAGGPVTWTAKPDAGVVVSPAAGQLADGERVVVRFTFPNALPDVRRVVFDTADNDPVLTITVVRPQ